jgi:thioredoxin 1
MTTETTAVAPDKPIHFEGDRGLPEIAAEYDVVLVDFYAEWCGPCKMMEPTIQTVAAETEAAVVKVDVDQFQHLAAEYGVQGVPTLVLFVDGEAVERMVGMQTEQQLVDAIDSYAD